MEPFRCLLLLLVVALVSGGIVPESLVVVETGGFSLRLEPGEYDSCQLVRNGSLYDLDTASSFSTRDDDGQLILPLIDDNVCGIRVDNVNQLSSGQWTLNGFADNLRITTGTATIQVDKSMPHKTEQKGRMSILSQDDIRSVRQLKREAAAAEQYENSRGSTIFQCAVSSVIQSCEIVHRNSGKRFNIQAGLAQAPFSSHKTDFNSGFCEFEIAPPFTEDVWGMWKMTIRSDHKDLNCRFTLSDDLAMQRLKEKQMTVPVIKTIEGSVELRCADKVPFEIIQCFIMTAQGMTFYENQDEMEGGSCKFRVRPGNWTCGFTGKQSNDQHFLQTFEVKQYEYKLIDGTIQNNDGILMMASHHIYKEPLRTCIFVSPSGKIYAIPSDTFRSTAFSFYGGNLKAGDCGIQLSAENFEGGKWLSIVRSERDSAQLKMYFRQADPMVPLENRMPPATYYSKWRRWRQMLR